MLDLSGGLWRHAILQNHAIRYRYIPSSSSSSSSRDDLDYMYELGVRTVSPWVETTGVGARTLAAPRRRHQRHAANRALCR